MKALYIHSHSTDGEQRGKQITQGHTTGQFWSWDLWHFWNALSWKHLWHLLVQARLPGLLLEVQFFSSHPSQTAGHQGQVGGCWDAMWASANLAGGAKISKKRENEASCNTHWWIDSYIRPWGSWTSKELFFISLIWRTSPWKMTQTPGYFCWVNVGL